ATMRGSAVPTMVWSSAARNIASAMPRVARIRALRVISPGTGCLLLLRICRGDGLPQVVERGADACALRRGQGREALAKCDRGGMLETLEVATAFRRQCDSHGAAVIRVALATDEAVSLETLDDLGDRRRRDLRLQRELARAASAGLETPEEPRALARAEIDGLRGALRDRAEQLEHAEHAFGERELFLGRGAGWRHTACPFGARIVREPKQYPCS